MRSCRCPTIRLSCVRRCVTCSLAACSGHRAVPEALARLEDELARLTPLLIVYAGDGPLDAGQG
jgi:hypothetical protein